MKRFSSPSQKIGKIGENVACMYLEKRHFSIIERNYTKKWGEIDIVASKGGLVHFIEVKSVSCESLDLISHETEGYRPEEQVHGRKRERLARTIETYVSSHAVHEWTFDLACIYLDLRGRRARVKFLEGLVL